MLKYGSSHLTMRNLMVVTWPSWWNVTNPSSYWEIPWSSRDAHGEAWLIPPHHEKSHGRHVILMVKYDTSIFTMRNLMVTMWCSWWNMAHPTSPGEISWLSHDAHGELWLLYLHHEKSHGHHVMLMMKHGSCHLTMRNHMVIMWCSWWNMAPPSSPSEISWSPCGAHGETWIILPHHEKSHSHQLVLMVKYAFFILISVSYTSYTYLSTNIWKWINIYTYYRYISSYISPWDFSWSPRDAHGETCLHPYHQEKSHGHHVMLMVKYAIAVPSWPHDQKG